MFGDVALVAFLLAQASDGVLTYIGVSTYGVRDRGQSAHGLADDGRWGRGLR